MRLLVLTLSSGTDIRRLFDRNGEVLPVHQWPDEVALSVRSFKRRPSGGVEITLYDALKARELMAIAGGKLRQKHDHRPGLTLADLLDPRVTDEELAAKLEGGV